MARPRTSSNVLELRGAFKKHPARRRKDAEGSAPFCDAPPSHLPAGAVPAWNYIVSRLPRISLYSCDEIAVEIAARLLAAYWLSGDIKTQAELRLWLAKLGMTPGDRTKIPPKEPEGKDSPASEFLG